MVNTEIKQRNIEREEYEEYDGYEYRSVEDLSTEEIAVIKEKAAKSKEWIKRTMGIEIPL